MRTRPSRRMILPGEAPRRVIEFCPPLKFGREVGFGGSCGFEAGTVFSLAELMASRVGRSPLPDVLMKVDASELCDACCKAWANAEIEGKRGPGLFERALR